MKTGQITTKLRDAVPVEFYCDGNERAQYKNIDIPDILKELEMTDFHFITPENGKISFRLTFAPGVLPEELPPAREKLTRAEKAAAKSAKSEEIQTEDLAAAAAQAIAAVTGSEVAVIPVDEIPTEDAASKTPAIPETRFNVTGERRKALAAAIGELTGESPKYLAAPSFAFAIGAYRVDKTGTFIGELAPELLAALAEQGFTPDEDEAE